MSGNPFLKSTWVVSLATMLIIPMIRPAKHEETRRPNAEKLQELVNKVALLTSSNEAVQEFDTLLDTREIVFTDKQLQDPLEMLQKIIPGKLTVDPLLDESQLAWKCKRCLEQRLPDPIAECFDLDTTVGFPFASNYTNFIGKHDMLGPDSVKQKLYAYSTSSLQSGNGRFSGGVMSLLLLEAIESQPGQWKVKKFNPSALYHGSFGAATGITSIINSTEFGSILLVNSISLLDADVEDCYAPVEDLYLLDGDQLSLIARIPGIRKVCQNQQDPNTHSDFPLWNTQIHVEPQGKNRLSILLEVEGAFGVNSQETGAKRQHMGLLTDLPSQFREDSEIPNSKDTTTISHGTEKSQALTPELIPYKAKISADISTSPINGLKQITPWKIEYNYKNGLPKSH